jgi:hypothetical protein
MQYSSHFIKEHPEKNIPHTSSSKTQKTVFFAVDELVLRREYFSQ